MASMNRAFNIAGSMILTLSELRVNYKDLRGEFCKVTLKGGLKILRGQQNVSFGKSQRQIFKVTCLQRVMSVALMVTNVVGSLPGNSWRAHGSGLTDANYPTAYLPASDPGAAGDVIAAAITQTAIKQREILYPG